MLPDSVVEPMPFHRGTVQFLVDGKVVGFGFRVSRGGKDIIVTARHNLNLMRTRRSDLRIAGPNGQLPLLGDSVAFMFPKADLVGLSVPAVLLSAIGVRSLKVSPPGADGTPIHIHGYMDGTRVKSLGVVMGRVKGQPLRFKHSASTVEGFSGSPVFNQLGLVIGMHIRSGSSWNEAVMLHWLLGSDESETYDKLFDRVDHPEDDWDQLIGFEGETMCRVRYRDRQFAPVEEFAVMDYNPRFSSWADDDDDDWYERMYGADDARDESADPLIAQVLKDPPADLAIPRGLKPIMDSPSAAIVSPTPSSGKSTPERSDSHVSVITSGLAGLTVGLSKGQRQRRNRRARNLASGLGLLPVLPPVSSPSLSTSQASVPASVLPGPISTRPCTAWSARGCTHAPMSLRDLKRIRHLAALAELGEIPISERSRDRSEWKELWTT
jgi:hypothetical protein